MWPIYDEPMPMLPPYRISARVGILSETVNYNHALLNIPELWESTKGGGVNVAILDTGLPRHIDIKPAGHRPDDIKACQDENGHATHVGGIIAAISDNDIGVQGVAPNCRDFYFRALGADGSGSINNVIRGIHWAVDVIGAKVINLSLGIPAEVQLLPRLEQACQYALEQGCTIICAAGNEAGSIGQPACYAGVITVAAVDRNKKHAWFSNIGPQVDFAAGGIQVYSTWLNNTYARLDGTSMATPAITGLVALVLAKHNRSTGKWMSPSEVYDLLKSVAVDVGPTGYDDQFGYGIPVLHYDNNSHNIEKDQQELVECPAGGDRTGTSTGERLGETLKCAAEGLKLGDSTAKFITKVCEQWLAAEPAHENNPE